MSIVGFWWTDWKHQEKQSLPSAATQVGLQDEILMRSRGEEFLVKAEVTFYKRDGVYYVHCSTGKLAIEMSKCASNEVAIRLEPM